MKKNAPKRHLALAGFLLIALGASAPPARADYTDNLLVGWTFNNGSLTSDLGTLAGAVSFTETGAGGNQTTAFDPNLGTVTLGSGRALVATGINSTAYPELRTDVTIWIRVTFNTVNSDVSAFGLVNATAPTDALTARTATFGLRSDGGTGSTGSRNVGFMGRSTQPAYLSPSSGWNNVTAGNTYDLAIRLDDNGGTGSIYSDWVDGTSVSRTWNGQNHDLQTFQSFMIGRILQSGGVGMTIDEVRIYNAVLTDTQLAQISAVTLPTLADLDNFGVNGTPQFRTDWESYCDHLIASGIKWIRISPEWGHIEPYGKNSHDDTYLAKLDAIVNRLHSGGVNILWVLCYTAPWASSNPDSPSASRYKPDDWADWADYVSFIADRYDGKIMHWEIWNEPDHSGFWKSSIADYFMLLKTAHESIKQANPENKVLLGGLAMHKNEGESYGIGGFFDNLMALEGENVSAYFDIVNYHAYGEQYAEHINRYDAINDVLREHSIQQKPIWITETGFSTSGNSELEGRKADMVAQIHAGNSRWPNVERYFWYRLENVTVSSGSQYEQNLGLLNGTLSPLRAFFEYQARDGAQTDFFLQSQYPEYTHLHTILPYINDTPGNPSDSNVTILNGDAIVAAGKYMYFKVSDDWLHDTNHGMDTTGVIEVEYLDEGTGSFSLQYDSIDPNVGDSRYKGAGTIFKGNSLDWKRATFPLNDIRFANRQNGASDFRLFARQGSLKVQHVTLKKELHATALITDAGQVRERSMRRVSDPVYIVSHSTGGYCWKIVKNEYCRFDVSDAKARSGDRNLEISIVFWATAAGTADKLAIQYNSISGNYTSKIFEETYSTPGWKTATFSIADADFRNAQDYGGDFRIVAGGASDRYVKKVVVRTLPLVTADCTESPSASTYWATSGTWSTDGGSWKKSGQGSGLAYKSETWTNYLVRAQFMFSAGTDTDVAGLLGRVTDADNYYFLYLNKAGDRLRLARKNSLASGAQTIVLKEAEVFPPLNTDAPFELRLGFNGDLIHGFVNETCIIRMADSYHANGGVGVRINGGSQESTVFVDYLEAR